MLEILLVLLGILAFFFSPCDKNASFRVLGFLLS